MAQPGASQLRLIAVSAVEEGTGSSTVCAALALALKGLGLRCRALSVPGLQGTIGSDNPVSEALKRATGGREVYPLNSAFLNTPEKLQAYVQRLSQGCDVALIDGMPLTEPLPLLSASSHTTAQLITHLKAHTLLVIDGRQSLDSIVSTVKTAQASSPALRAPCVVINHADPDRSYTPASIQTALTDAGLTCRVVGCIGTLHGVVGGNVPSVMRRYLEIDTIMHACPPSQQAPAQSHRRFFSALAATIGSSAGHHASAAAAAVAAHDSPQQEQGPTGAAGAAQPVVAVALDEAFRPAFAGDIAALEAAGARVVPFSPLHDPQLPSHCQAVLLGGAITDPHAWPAHARRLAANAAMRAALRAFCRAGGVVWAQSAGVVYLSSACCLPDTHAQQGQQQGQQQLPMVGVLPFRACLYPAAWPASNGYVDLTAAPAVRHLLGAASATGAGPAAAGGGGALGASWPLPALFHSRVDIVEEKTHQMGPWVHPPLNVPGGTGGYVSEPYNTAFTAVAVSGSSSPSSGSSTHNNASVSPPASPRRPAPPQSPHAAAPATAAAAWPAGYVVHNVLASPTHWPLAAAPDVLAAWLAAAARIDAARVQSAVLAAAAASRAAASADGGDASVAAAHTTPTRSASALSDLGPTSSPDPTCAYAGQVAADRAAHSPSPQLTPRSHVAWSSEYPQPLPRPLSNGALSNGHVVVSPAGSHGMGVYGVRLPGAYTAYSPPLYPGPKGSLSPEVSPPNRVLAPLPIQGMANTNANGVMHLARPGSSLDVSRTPQQGAHAERAPRRSLCDRPPAPLPPHPSLWPEPVKDKQVHTHTTHTTQSAYPTQPSTTHTHQQQSSPCDINSVHEDAHTVCDAASGPPQQPQQAYVSGVGSRRTSATWHHQHPHHNTLGTIQHIGSVNNVSTSNLGSNMTKLHSRNTSFGSLADSHAQGAQVAGAVLAGVAGGMGLWEPRAPALSDGIVSLCPGATETLAAMGLAGRLVGISDACDWPPQLRSTKIDEDLLIEERPSLIVLPDLRQLSPADQKQLTRALQHTVLGPQHHHGGAAFASTAATLIARGAAAGAEGALVLVHAARTLSDVLELLLRLGDAAGAPQAAGTLADRLRARLRRAARAAAAAAAGPPPTIPPPRVLVLSYLRGAPIAMQRAGLWVPEMLALAGAAQAERPWAAALHTAAAAAAATAVCEPGDAGDAVTWEELQILAPDVLIIAHDAAAGGVNGAGACAMVSERSQPHAAGVATCACSPTLAALATLATYPGWWSLPCVRAGAVYLVDSPLINRAGPRLVDGVEIFAGIVDQYRHYAHAQLSRPPGAPVAPRRVPSAHDTAAIVAMALASSPQATPAAQSAGGASGLAPTAATVMPKCASGSVLKLALCGGQRCRPSLLPHYFIPWPATPPSAQTAQ